MILQGNETLYDRCFLIHFDHGIAGGHHHLIRKTDILSSFRGFLNSGGVEWEEIFEIVFFPSRENEFKSIQRGPRVELV